MAHKFSIQSFVAHFSLLALGTVAGLLGPQLLTEAERSQLAVAQSVPAEESSPNSSEEIEIGSGVLLALAALGGGAAILLGARKSNGSFKSLGQEKTSQIEQASPQLRKKLLRLLHNDQATASRLVAQVRRNNPSQSINWAAEKAIYDLERDRH